jgi:lysophospholipase L1-like esterase
MFNEICDKEVDSMRGMIAASLIVLAAMTPSRAARAGSMTYLSIGDSIAFGETTFTQNPSNGDRGFVADYANYLATQNGGVRPNVVNLGIDGETTSSFISGTGRIQSVPGSTDQSIASWNTNYTDPTVTQNVMFQQAIAAQKAAGNDVGVVTISLGANDLFKLAASPGFLTASPADQQAQLNQTLTQIASNYSVALAEVRSLLPNAKIYTLGEYNPFPGQPSNPLNGIADYAIKALNATIGAEARAFNAQYVDTYSPFVGNEAKYTYIAAVPGDVHPNALGYAAIAGQIEATPTPEPSTLAVLGLGFATLAVAARRRRDRVAA